MANRKLPDDMLSQIDAELIVGADRAYVRSGSTGAGITTDDVVAAADAGLARIREAYGDVGQVLMRRIAAARVPAVLGGDTSGVTIRVLRDPLVSGLDLPQWLSVPQASGRPRWKKLADASIPELSVAIGHKRSDIEGRQVELSKYVRLQREADRRARDCTDPGATLRELLR